MKYPTGIKKEYKSIQSHSNRGMNLENDLNDSNNYYIVNDIAVIYKKPTPITINKVDYKSRVDAVIKEAHFKIPSTTDYNGIYKGMYIDFEAKETKSTTSFPLSNIHSHQIEDLINFLDNNERVSIPVDYFDEFGHIIKEGLNPRLDYLKILDQKGV